MHVSKLDLVLHLSLRFLLPRLSVSSSQRPLPLFLDAGDVRDSTGPAWAREMERKRLEGMRVRTPWR
jgi:hypothetical protein